MARIFSGRFGGKLVLLGGLWLLPLGSILFAQSATAAATPAATVSPTASPSPSASPIPGSTAHIDAWAPSQAAVGSNIAVISSDTLKMSHGRSLADLLKEVAGITISDHDGIRGDLQRVSIRGSSGEEVAIFVDGQRLIDPLFGAYNLALLSVDQVERIEILRGSAAAIYGQDAAGGVVYISTRAEKPGLRVNLENRSYIPVINNQLYSVVGILALAAADWTSLIGTQHAGLVGSLGLGEGRVTFNAGFDRDLGLFTYTDATGTLVQNSQTPTLGGNAGVGLEIPLGAGTFFVKGDGLMRRTGLPGTIISPMPSQYRDDTAINGRIGWGTPALGSQDLSLDVQLSGNWNQLTYSGGTPINVGAIVFDAKQTVALSEMFRLGYGISGRYDTTDAPGSTPYRLSGGIFLSPALKTGGFSMTPNIRLDIFSDNPAGLSANLDTDLALSPNFELFLGLANAYRVPTFVDVQTITYISNPVIPILKPEKAWSADFGLAIKSDFLTSRSSVFLRYVQDEIRWIQVPYNIPETLYPGFDQDFSLKLDFFRAGLNYEYIHSYYMGPGVTISDEKRVPQTPEQRVRARVGIKLAGIELSANAELNGPGFWDFANNQIMPMYFLLNGTLALWFSETSNVYAAADNILNASYQTNLGYAQPGFCVRIGLNLAF